VTSSWGSMMVRRISPPHTKHRIETSRAPAASRSTSATPITGAVGGSLRVGRPYPEAASAFFKARPEPNRDARVA
jgi:hypothetical protein